MADSTILHRITVEQPMSRVYKFSCSCGVVLYNGPDSRVGETRENRHIREHFGGYRPPPSTVVIDWDRVGTWFMLGWLLSD